MSEASQQADTGPSHRSLEIGVALTTALFGIVVMVGSVKAGIGWGDEGPKAGFFPFYVGVVVVLSSVVNLALAFGMPRPGAMFASWSQLRSVLAVVIPTAIYVGAMPYLGIYVTSALLIGGFMRWLGRYSWLMTIVLAVAIPIAIFITFERWFLVPLPKGPVEDFLGF